MGHFVWDFENKFILVFLRKTYIGPTSMNRTSQLAALTQWSGNIGHEKVLKLSPVFKIFDLNMRKLGRLGTKTKHEDLSNFVSLIGRKTNFGKRWIFDWAIFSNPKLFQDHWVTGQLTYWAKSGLSKWPTCGPAHPTSLSGKEFKHSWNLFLKELI